MRGAGRLAEAGPHFAAALAGFERALPPGHAWTLTATLEAALFADAAGDAALAEARFRTALAGRRALYGAAHVDTARSARALDAFLAARGRPAEVATAAAADGAARDESAVSTV